MKQVNEILTINGGSSSIKFAIYACAELSAAKLFGKIDRIGLNNAKFIFKEQGDIEAQVRSFAAPDYNTAIQFLMEWLEKKIDLSNVKAIGHRVVYGMSHTKPEVISKDLLEELHLIRAYDPDHLPFEIKLIEAFRKSFPGIVQVACFDTAFHTAMPRVAKLVSIPRRFEEHGIQRYGFHGLSYTFLMEELKRIEGEEKSKGRIILAHLGNGASLAAVSGGKSMDTTMGFTPAGGLPMSSRCGDIDPGVAWYILKSENMTATQFNHLINHESGLLGISQTSADMENLLKQETTDLRSAEAIDFFCYQVKKWIGAYSAALGGLDTLVFSGGIGENAAVIRSRICMGLQFLGIELDEKKNENNEAVISVNKSLVTVRMIHTDEESMIAKSVFRILEL